MSIQITNICAKFYSNPSTKYGDIVSREIGANGQRTTDGQTDGRTDGQHDALSPTVVGKCIKNCGFLNPISRNLQIIAFLGV